jgi:8-oxo-dGTP pyrophosphatase MutT (NUDIX family)
MKKEDLLLKTNSGIFSYRVAGVLIRDGKVLVQHEIGDTSYAFPGGHLSFGESSEETLKREYKEEMGADITTERLLWIQENFWKWGTNDCHQLCLYYLIKLCDETQIPLEGAFTYKAQLESEMYKLELSWIEISRLKDFKLYPPFAKDKLINLSNNIEHFIVRQ